MANTDEQRALVKKTEFVHLAAAAVVLVVTFPLAMTGNLPLTHTRENELRSLGQQYGFAFKWFSLQVLWLLVAIANVGRSRGQANALPGTGN